MLANKDVVANIAVKNMDTAKKFYQDTLGLTLVEHRGSELTVFKSGNSLMYVYQSQFAGTNKATAVTWVVPDVEKTVGELKAKGIGFEHYAIPDMQIEGDVHLAGSMKMAWFKDPDGNILHVVNE